VPHVPAAVSRRHGGATDSAPHPSLRSSTWADLDDAMPSLRGPLKVLIVEDSPAVQRTLRELIETPGLIEVCGLADAEDDGVKLFERHEPHVIVVDLSLRRGSGLGLIQKVRLHEKGEDVLVMVLTNHTVQALRHACEAAGCDYFLDKASEVDRLLDLIQVRSELGT
jgi:DNA-binding NarL/FixJ family response regulator